MNVDLSYTTEKTKVATDNMKVFFIEFTPIFTNTAYELKKNEICAELYRAFKKNDI